MTSVLGKRMADGEAEVDLVSTTDHQAEVDLASTTSYEDYMAQQVDMAQHVDMTQQVDFNDVIDQSSEADQDQTPEDLKVHQIDFNHYLWSEEFSGVDNVWHYTVAFKGDRVNVQSLCLYVVRTLRCSKKIIKLLTTHLNPSDKYLPLDQALQLCVQIMTSSKKPKKTKTTKITKNSSASFCYITQAKILLQKFSGSTDYTQLLQAPAKARQTFEDSKGFNQMLAAMRETVCEHAKACTELMKNLQEELAMLMQATHYVSLN
jgi:hypothetical protein